MKMHAHRVSVSIPQPLYDFIEEYQHQQQISHRSEVISEALKLLQQAQLEAYYREANQEIDDAFDITSGDGLDDNETW